MTMTEQDTITISTSDIESAFARLDEFRRGLAPNEQVVLDLVLARAAAAEPAATDVDVQGYVLAPPQHTSPALFLGLHGTALRSGLLSRYGDRGIIIIGG
jgi:hypothetical protein